MTTTTNATRLFLAVAGCAALAASEPQFKHGVSFFGDFKYAEGFKHFDYVNPDAPKGGMMVLATDDPWNSFTPYLHKGIVAPGVQHDFGSNPFFYDGLFTASDDEIGTFYGNLAEGVLIADDFTRVRVRLRSEARWHDGVPVTARDVRFTFEHIAANSAFNLQSAFGMVDSVQVHGDYDLTFHLNDVNGLNAAVVSSLGKIAILPEHYWREADNTKTTQTPPLGSGPYRIAEFEQSRSLLYERVPDYWGRDLGVHRGRHNLDAIRYDFYRDDTVAREAFRKGLIDVWRETDPRFWFDRYDDALAKGWIGQAQAQLPILRRAPERPGDQQSPGASQGCPCPRSPDACLRLRLAQPGDHPRVPHPAGQLFRAIWLRRGGSAEPRRDPAARAIPQRATGPVVHRGVRT